MEVGRVTAGILEVLLQSQGMEEPLLTAFPKPMRVMILWGGERLDCCFLKEYL